jgi:hypothetical protein
MEEGQVTPEQLAEAVDALKHIPAFKVYNQWLSEVKDNQVTIVAQGGTDPYRQYLETGVLQGIMRIQGCFLHPIEE